MKYSLLPGPSLSTSNNNPALDVDSLLATLPTEPGVYRMCGADGHILYVGKAKNLKKRVSSYFQKTNHAPRITLMLNQVVRVDITATRSEAEALILENTLIKRLTPKYNILFRDDKSYPYIKLSADAFPRIAFHRGSFDARSRYFGPYPSSGAVRESLQLLQQTFLLRTCENSVFSNRSRPCLLYQIKRCKAPCVGLIGEQDYAADASMAQLFLTGRHGEVIERLSTSMQEASDAMKFEAAAALRDQIRALQSVLHRQYVSSTGGENADILSAVEAPRGFCINLAMVRGGLHLGDRTHFPHGAGEYGVTEGLLAFIEQHYLQHPAPSRVILSHDLGNAYAGVFQRSGQKISVGLPRNEMERAWLSMATNNARLAIEARRHAAANARLRLDALRDALELPEPPIRIECFDISHTQGEGTIASCVVCISGTMKESEYRRFNVSAVQPGDDYAAMHQVLLRRYGKVVSGEAVSPDLVLIDGGKGQLAVANEALRELGLGHLQTVGIAKGEGRRPGLETLFIGQSAEPVKLPQDDPALHLLQEIRDEAHRFAIMGHRAKRAKTRGRSVLEDVPGIGPAKRRNLLAHFGGLPGVAAATVDDLCRVNGISRALAEAIHDELH